MCANMFVFRNVWVCVVVGFVVGVFVYVDFVMCGCVFCKFRRCVCVGFLMCMGLAFVLCH